MVCVTAAKNFHNDYIMKKIIAKFQCNSVIQATEGYPATARLSAVYANADGTENEENKSFSDATPSGYIEISISPDAPAHKFFRPQRYYYLEFTRIPMTEAEIEQQKAWEEYERKRKETQA